MIDHVLQGRRILVVEDEYLLADHVREALQDAGAEVIGPCPNVASATAMLDDPTLIDAALLDVNLGGELVFPLAEALTARGVPFAFTTGYDRAALPDRYLAVNRIEKPMRPDGITRTLLSMMPVHAEG